MTTLRTSILAIFLLAVAGAVMAEPFLVSDPYPLTGVQPTKFVVTVGGTSRDVVPEKNPDGRLFLKYDLSSLPDGLHTVKVKAVNSTLKLESSEVSLPLQKAGSKVSRARDEGEKLSPTRTYPGYIRQ